MKTNIQYILIATIFTLTQIIAQVRPFNPPKTEIIKQIFPTHLMVQELNSIYPSLEFNNFPFIQNNNFMCYQMSLETNLSQEIEIQLDYAFNSNDDFYYIRYSDDGFLGPFNYLDQIKDNILLISGVNPQKFVIEYCAEEHQITKYPNLSIIKKIENPQIENSMIGSSKYWKRNREVPKVLVTGFWPPTNEMIRHFSTNSELNPDGWVGGDWEERGYDIVSYFPEFEEPNCNDCGMGYGDLEVDYQDTSIDFWNIVNDIQPTAIVTFSRGYIDHSWELEFNFYNRINWYADYLAPLLPTPNPPDEGVENYFERNSTLPMDEIEDAVEEAGLGLNAYIDWQGDPGHFVSEFMGYHGVWYRDINQQSENICHIAGHVHVGGLVDWDIAREATHITIRKVLDHLDQFDYILGDVNEDTFINIQDLLMMVQFILGNQEPMIGESFAADMNIDSTINIQDVIIIINIILGN